MHCASPCAPCSSAARRPSSAKATPRYGNLAVNIRHRLRQCPPVPCTSIYSKSDGLVPWELCAETESAQSENIEIEGATHRGLPAHPKVLEAITQRLAQPEGEWRPFDSQSSIAFN